MRASVLFRLKQARDRALRKSALIYFAVQAGAVLAWWIALSIFPAWRLHFFPSHVLESGLGGWFMTDVATVVIPSIAAAVLGQLQSRFTSVTALVAFVGLTYAGAYCAAWAFRDGLFLPAIMMAAAVAATGVATYGVAKKT